MSKLRLEVIYCDDVRQELGNKQSFIGVYPGDLYVESMPIVLPKLCVVATLSLSSESHYESLRVKVMEGEQCIFKTSDITPLPTPPDVAGDLVGQDPEAAGGDGIRVGIVLVLSPFQIDEETSLRVIAEGDGMQIPGRGLRIRRAARQSLEQLVDR